MGLSAPKVVHEQDFRDISADKLLPLGTVAETRDGRKFRYALNGASNLAPGKICVAAAHVANHVNRLADVARAVGSEKASFTSGATAGTADQYADGLLVVNDADGEGIAYRIRTHAAWSSSGVATFQLDEPIEVALTTSSELSAIRNPWSAVIVAAGDAVTYRAVGVPNVAITAAYYGWLQTKGDCSVLSDGVIGKGSGAILSNAVAGAVEVEVATTVENRVGRAPEATVDTEYRLIDLCID